MRKTNVYLASKLAHAKKWRELDWPEINLTARWPHSHVGVPDTADFARLFWTEDEDDVMSSDVVLVYAEDGEHLRGALVEAGMGIALGKHVIVVGDHPDFGTWQYHPMVLRAKTLEQARSIIVGLV